MIATHHNHRDTQTGKRRQCIAYHALRIAGRRKRVEYVACQQNAVHRFASRDIYDFRDHLLLLIKP